MKRVAVVVLAIAFVATACGLKVPATLVAGSAPEGGTATGLPTTGPDGGVKGPGVKDVDPGTPGGPNIGPSGTTTTGPLSSLFLNETEGITNSRITICAHVPITGAAPIPHNPHRFGQFYFNAVNAEKGGVYGRKVSFIAENDQYNPVGARNAVEKCSRNGAFMFQGAAGTDQIVSVSEWAEKRKVPYFHGPTSDRDLKGRKYNVFSGPTYEAQHRFLARYLVKRFGTKVAYGAIRVNSPYFEAGMDAYKSELKKLGVTLAVDMTVQKDESQFQNVYFEMEDKNVQVINNFTTPNIWIKMLNQKKATYNPTWTAVSPVAGFNIVAAALKNAKAVVLSNFNPACECTTYKDEEISQHKDLPWYDDIQEFLRIFKKYSPEQDPPPDDFDYSSYLAAKSTHRLLLKLGPKPTRSGLFDLLDEYKETSTATFPGCPSDFTRNDLRMGAWRINIFDLVSDRGVWKQTASCVDIAK